MQIWKFPLSASGTKIEVPKGAKPLSVQVQHGVPVLYAEVDPAQPMHNRHIGIFATGQELPAARGTFVDTFQLAGGELVFHVYDLLC